MLPNEPTEQQMTSTRPYLVRSFYEWILDNDMTPYLVIDATVEFTRVPLQFVEGGKIVLNISPMATDELLISNYSVEFEASFSGSVERIFAPIQAVLAIYARENGRGMVFGEDEDMFEEPPAFDGGGDDDGDGGSKPKLRVVK